MSVTAAGLELTGRPVLVVGGGVRALNPVADLQRAGAVVTVCAADLETSLQDLVERDLLHWHAGEPTDEVVSGAALVVAATGDASADDAVLELAARHHVVAVRADATRPTGSPVPQDGPGEVILVGGGPGDPDLLTVGGLRALREADVIICDRLAPLAALSEARDDAEIIDVGKIPRGRTTSQEVINKLLITHATSGKRVVRLKGGDNFVFGRGGEEWLACAEQQIPVTIIPGVTSAIAVPGLAGIPITHRDLVQGFSVVSGHAAPGADTSTIDWGGLSRSGTTLVILMGVANLDAIARTLINEGTPATTPAAVVADGGLPSMRTVRAPLADIAASSTEAGIKAPAVIVIGAVAAFSV